MRSLGLTVCCSMKSGQSVTGPIDHRRYLVYKWWLYSLKNKMYMYLIYIIELRRKPLFSSLPTNNALDNWTLFIILRILRISNA